MPWWGWVLAVLIGIPFVAMFLLPIWTAFIVMCRVFVKEITKGGR